MEPEAPLPPQPPELTARYNKKVLTLEEIVQAHGNSVHAQKYSIEVVGGKIKAVCNDCKVAHNCVDNPWLRDAFALVGIGMMSERSLLTSQLLLRYQEVQRKVAKQVAELEVTNVKLGGWGDSAKMLIYIKANAGLGARHNTEAQLLARMGE
ncbi:hypothetical protein QJQ45_020669 [Haematococcus lacustris]|nr:hypothetical protein QJQ45_020669 [Haematococcus lacustris]